MAPDHLLSLSNERTYLAYVRTSLALVAGGLAVLGFLRFDDHPEAPVAVGSALFGVGIVTLVGGHLRWRRVARAIESGAAMPSTIAPVVITALLLGLAAVALFTVVVLT